MTSKPNTSLTTLEYAVLVIVETLGPTLKGASLAETKLERSVQRMARGRDYSFPADARVSHTHTHERGN